MKNLKFIYYPNSNITLALKASNILKYYDQFLTSTKYIYELNENETYIYLINLNFRPCVPGEIYRSESEM